APHYLAEPFSSALKPGSKSEAFFCHISWRQTHGGHTRAKRVKKATPRYVAGPLAPLRCVYRDFGGIRAILSGGNPPRDIRQTTAHPLISCCDTPCGRRLDA